MDIKNMSPELRAKALACTSADELLKLAKEEGIELTDEQLEAVSGGDEWLCKSNSSCYDDYPVW